MSSNLFLRLLAVGCCVAMLQIDISQSQGQGIRGALQSAQQGAQERLPTRGQSSYSEEGDRRAAAAAAAQGRGESRDGGRGERSNGERRGDGKPAKFDELLANKDLSRFRGYKEAAIGDGWKMDGKSIHFDGSGGGDIVTVDQYDNFDLQFDWKVSKGGNSGVMYRVSLGDDAPYMSGIEYQVLDDAEHADGKNELTSAGSLYALYAPQNKKPRAAGIWNSTKIIVDGNSITHYLNGVKVVEAELGSEDWNTRLGNSKFAKWEKFAKNSTGHIAFQDHGNEVWFRKIRIKRLASSEGAEQTARTERPAERTKRADPRAAAAKGRDYAAEQGSGQTSGRGETRPVKPAKPAKKAAAADTRTPAEKARDFAAEQGASQSQGRGGR